MLTFLPKSYHTSAAFGTPGQEFPKSLRSIHSGLGLLAHSKDKLVSLATLVIHDIEYDLYKKHYIRETVKTLGKRLSEHSKQPFTPGKDGALSLPGTDIHPEQGACRS